VLRAAVEQVALRRTAGLLEAALHGALDVQTYIDLKRYAAVLTGFVANVRGKLRPALPTV